MALFVEEIEVGGDFNLSRQNESGLGDHTKSWKKKTNERTKCTQNKIKQAAIQWSSDQKTDPNTL